MDICVHNVVTEMMLQLKTQNVHCEHKSISVINYLHTLKIYKT